MKSLKSLVLIPAWQRRTFDQLYFVDGCVVTNGSKQSHDRAWHHWRWGLRGQAGPESAWPAMLLATALSPVLHLAVANSLPWGLVINQKVSVKGKGFSNDYYSLLFFYKKTERLKDWYQYKFSFFKFLLEQNEKQFKYQRESGSFWHESKMQ